ncbi:MAG: hypothetical protein MMC23_000351 [Stictis urceolatum]|nr:hypothetical protein [Stictis urceolata]
MVMYRRLKSLCGEIPAFKDLLESAETKLLWDNMEDFFVIKLEILERLDKELARMKHTLCDGDADPEAARLQLAIESPSSFEVSDTSSDSESSELSNEDSSSDDAYETDRHARK